MQILKKTNATLTGIEEHLAVFIFCLAVQKKWVLRIKRLITCSAYFSNALKELNLALYQLLNIGPNEKLF